MHCPRQFVVIPKRDLKNTRYYLYTYTSRGVELWNLHSFWYRVEGLMAKHTRDKTNFWKHFFAQQTPPLVPWHSVALANSHSSVSTKVQPRPSWCWCKKHLWSVRNSNRFVVTGGEVIDINLKMYHPLGIRSTTRCPFPHSFLQTTKENLSTMTHIAYTCLWNLKSRSCNWSAPFSSLDSHSC